MANEEHLKILKQGVEVWNRWRENKPEILDANPFELLFPDLRGADLRKTDLSGADLQYVNLSQADLRGANLQGANLTSANLFNTNLMAVDLVEANLSHTNLTGAKIDNTTLISSKWQLVWKIVNQSQLNQTFFEADLQKVDLSNACLNNVNLMNVNLTDANLSKVQMHGTFLSEANLTRASLQGADLNGTDLSKANLKEANLSNAYLNKTDLMGASLEGANLNGASLVLTSLIKADLSKASLIGVRIFSSDFLYTNFNGTNLSRAKIGWTGFRDVDLSEAHGLDTIIHEGPSTIGIDTIYRSNGRIPETFLRGAGIPDTFIAYATSFTGEAIQYYSCFISYSSKDETFAQCLYADLQQKGVRCWFASEDMKIGDKIRDRIDESIRIHDKLLLILSEQSIKSDWVEKEVEAAFEEERKRGQTVLFPVRLDEAVMETNQAWAAEIRRTQHLGDFSCWKDHDAYQKAFERLLRDLRAKSNEE